MFWYVLIHPIIPACRHVAILKKMPLLILCLSVKFTAARQRAIAAAGHIAGPRYTKEVDTISTGFSWILHYKPSIWGIHSWKQWRPNPNRDMSLHHRSYLGTSWYGTPGHSKYFTPYIVEVFHCRKKNNLCLHSKGITNLRIQSHVFFHNGFPVTWSNSIQNHSEEVLLVSVCYGKVSLASASGL